MNYLTTDTELTSVANAIREKGGTSSTLEYPQGFIDAIQNIGPAVLQPKDVNFYDFDGTLLYSYTFTEANALTSLPASPTRSRLTFQEWNWTLAQIKAYITAVPGARIDVGATYTTSSGNTEIDIVLTDNLTVVLYINVTSVSPALSCDWGDGTSSSAISSTGYVHVQHTYSRAGEYTISFSGGRFGFVSGSYVPFITDVAQRLANGIDQKMSGVVSRIRLGNNYRWIPNGIRCLRNLESISVPKGCEVPQRMSILRNDSLKCIVIPSDVVTSDGFDRNISLEVVCVSPVMTSFCTQIFMADASLKNITIPTSVTTIGTYAFYEDFGLEKLIYPSTLTSVGAPQLATISGYYSMFELKRVEFLCPYSALSSTNIAICNGFYSLEKFKFPTGFPYVTNNQFNQCSNLKEITIPDGATYIGANAFSICLVLEEVTVPDSVSDIYSSAFYNSGIKTLHMKPTTPPSYGSNVFNVNALPNDFVIKVPYSSDHSVLNAYKAASGWSALASYMQEEAS